MNGCVQLYIMTGKEQPVVADTSSYQTEVSEPLNVEAKSSGESSSAQKEQPILLDKPCNQTEVTGPSSIEAKSSSESLPGPAVQKGAGAMRRVQYLAAKKETVPKITYTYKFGSRQSC